MISLNLINPWWMRINLNSNWVWRFRGRIILCSVKQDEHLNKIFLMKFQTSIISPYNVFQFPHHLIISSLEPLEKGPESSLFLCPRFRQKNRKLSICIILPSSSKVLCIFFTTAFYLFFKSVYWNLIIGVLSLTSHCRIVVVRLWEK